jgi:molecular chaperone DnaK
MVKDAEAHAEEDKKRRELVEAKNQGEALIHASEKTISEAGDKLSESDRKPVEEAIAALKTALEGENLDDIRAKTETLGQLSMKLGEAMYQAGEAAGEAETGTNGSGTGSGAGASEEDEQVVDADLEPLAVTHRRPAVRGSRRRRGR